MVENVACLEGSLRSSLICQPLPGPPLHTRTRAGMMTYDCNVSSREGPHFKKEIVANHRRRTFWPPGQIRRRQEQKKKGGWVGNFTQRGFLDVGGISKLKRFRPPFAWLQENFIKKKKSDIYPRASG